jgi:hypothetical protein
MRKLPVRIGSVVATASAALMLAGGTAFAGPAGPAGPAAKTVTGPEVVSGSAHGKAAIANVTPIPLTLAGVVATTDRGFTLGPGGGKFAGATGPGAYQVFFGAYAPRYTSGKHKGQCDTASNAVPLAKGAVATFLAAGVLTVG